MSSEGSGGALYVLTYILQQVVILCPLKRDSRESRRACQSRRFARPNFGKRGVTEEGVGGKGFEAERTVQRHRNMGRV